MRASTLAEVLTDVLMAEERTPLLQAEALSAVRLAAGRHSWGNVWREVVACLPAEGSGLLAEAVKVSDSPYLSEMALIGVVKRGHRPLDFRGGSVTAVIGGVELDLRKANLTSTAYLDVVAFWGGIEIKVPAGWTVDARVVPVMGAFENKVDSMSASGGPRLVVRGHAIMGAVAIGS